MSMLGNLTIAKSTSYISTIPNKSCSQLLYLRVDAYSEALKWSTGHWAASSIQNFIYLVTFV